MKDYEYDKSDWKDRASKAFERLLVNVIAVVPLLAAAAVLSMILHSLLSEPFKFSCKSVPADHSNRPIPKIVFPSPTDDSRVPMANPSETKANEE